MEHSYLTGKDFFGERLNAKFPGFDEKWKELVKKTGDGFVGYLREKIQDQFQLFKDIANFRVTVVIDNNFIFGQIKNVVEKGRPLSDSFLYRISKFNSVKIYAPPTLVEELFEKIEDVLEGDKDLAREYANKILENVEVKDAYWINEWKKANNLIGHIDIDDVPYLALAIEVGSHGIVTNDDHFHKQGAAKVWTLNIIR